MPIQDHERIIEIWEDLRTHEIETTYLNEETGETRRETA